MIEFAEAEVQTQLKCCPYCGGDPERGTDILGCPFVRCVVCYAEVAAVWMGATQADADARWNRRIGEAA